jgi:tripartite motif-containing protein 2/3/tripartite motif-containing protein 71
MTIKKALAKLDACCGEISDQRATTADQIHISFRKLRKVLNIRETELIDQLDRTTQNSLKNLAAQRDEIETTLAQLNSCLHFIEESLRPGNEGDVLMTKTKTENQVKELTTPFQPHFLEPITEANMKFLTSADMVGVCQNYGQILSPDLVDPSKCKVDTKVAIVREKCSAILHLASFNGEPSRRLIEGLRCEIMSVLSGTRASCIVERKGQSQYEISYHPTIKGRHQLHVEIQGHHIKESPFSVAVKLPVEKLGTPILTIDGVKGPCGVAINQRGEVVVAECGGHCISVFSPRGAKLLSFGTHGTRPGQMMHPSGVAVDGEENILVADCDNHRIQRFTSEGQFSTTGDSGHLQFISPTGVASNYKVYVADANKHRVQILNSDLTFSGTFGKRGSGLGHFYCPFSIACDSTGKVYVADQCNHRIQVFTAKGKFLLAFGRRGRGRGELREPTGVAIDTSDMVYVSEYGNNRVSVFTSKGQFVTSFGREGVEPGKFKHPYGLAVDESGVVYVCDRENNRVQVF